MHRFVFSLGFLLAIGAHSAAAQTSIGPRLGYNAAWYRGNTSFERPLTYEPEWGLQAGIVLEQRFGRLAVQPSVLFTHKGSYITDRDEQRTTGGQPYVREFRYRQRLNYVELQLPLVYTHGTDRGWQLFAGPYAALGASGKGDGAYLATLNGQRIDGYAGSGGIRFAADGSEYYSSVHPYDVGVLGGVGYRLRHGQLQAGYTHGFSNRIVEKVREVGTERQSTVFVAFTYLFALSQQ
ncbi:PorT family protein [Hymenobacter gummosus]|uniref:PorT family protein n=1 Tax=Hymenobacter gummosus TaxID=1776032 RepID=A0A3S0IMS0_9BACT|nr:outer membrane beta-barrel protein [Hymenobacter gummosus]RTQ49154.1 PorT family protein [Hymenobacter gummosus]